MWIFLEDAFLSIVDKDGDGTTLLVRARREGDLERAFPGAEVHETRNHDYRFRAQVDRETVARAIADRVRRVAYPNFKDTVRDPARHTAYMGVWEVMYRYQQGRNR